MYRCNLIKSHVPSTCVYLHHFYSSVPTRTRQLCWKSINQSMFVSATITFKSRRVRGTAHASAAPCALVIAVATLSLPLELFIFFLVQFSLARSNQITSYISHSQLFNNKLQLNLNYRLDSYVFFRYFP